MDGFENMKVSVNSFKVFFGASLIRGGYVIFEFFLL